MVVDQFWELVDLARSEALTTERRLDLEAVAAALQNRLQELPLEQTRAPNTARTSRPAACPHSAISAKVSLRPRPHTPRSPGPLRAGGVSRVGHAGQAP